MYLTLHILIISYKYTFKYNYFIVDHILLFYRVARSKLLFGKKILYRFKNILKDGSAFYITNPSFASQKPGSFKITPQDQKLTFVHNIVLKECVEFSGSRFGFSFVDYQTVLSLLHLEDTSIVCSSYLYICIIALQLRVNLWGDYVYTMQDYLDNNPPNQHVVVILQFAKISVWRLLTHTLHLQSCSLTPTSMKLVFSKKVIESKQLSELDDFVVKTNLKTIAEIFEPLSAFPDNGVKDDIDVHESNAKSISYECRNQNCIKIITSVVLRFIIPIHVQDNIRTTLTMFEKEGRYLLKTLAKRIGDNTDFYQGEINALKVLKLAFKISVSDFNVSKKTNQYGISRVSDNVDLTEQLENKFTESQTGITHSLDVCSGEFESQDNRP
uniref:Uncharacterized protein n=1 Tax=Lactuca sativa TaxID=4236 RepID=A0A9R1XYB9_LACSA|nr:hypothetical protein LSAT_V11C100042710 [Lactuca sativa]